jgi:D-erythrulose 1-phosphate 3-epimerase
MGVPGRRIGVGANRRKECEGVKVHLGVDNIYAAKRWPEPDVWGQQVAQRWGLKHVQFCFDLLDPRSTEQARQRYCDEVKQAASKYGFQVHNCFIGAGAYTYNLLLHPFEELREDAKRWCELASLTSEQMGARAVGGPIAAASVQDYLDPSKRAFLLDKLVEGMQHWARHAAQHGQDYILWEPTPVGREMLIHLDEGLKLYERLNQDVPIPIYFCLDVGHACGYEMEGRDRDICLWLEELGRYSPVIHLQQMDGIWDRHWPFSKKHNAEGVIRMEKVLEALDKSGAEEVYLFPEVVHPFEFRESELLQEMDEMFEYLHQFV